MAYEFQEGELRRLQLKTLEMLVFFRDYCEEKGLTFMLCGGCCIGALREGGFLPWDDDADVFMPREDYERLAREWEGHERYALLHPGEGGSYGNAFTTLVDTATTCLREQTKDRAMPHGIALDIFPLDGCPTGWRRLRQKWNAMLFSLFVTEVVPQKHGRLIALGSRTLLGLVRSPARRQRVWRRAERRMSRFPIAGCERITELCAGPHYMQKEYPKAAFAGVVWRDFEGERMPLPAGYDDYLTLAFGDYMTPPPPGKRIPEHDIVFLDLERGEKG